MGYYYVGLALKYLSCTIASVYIYLTIETFMGKNLYSPGSSDGFHPTLLRKDRGLHD